MPLCTLCGFPIDTIPLVHDACKEKHFAPMKLSPKGEAILKLRNDLIVTDNRCKLCNGYEFVLDGITACPRCLYKFHSVNNKLKSVNV